jgi:multiple sugar transport system substrate-binding protein
MKKLKLVLILILAIGIALYGCSSDAGQTGEEQDSGNDANASADNNNDADGENESASENMNEDSAEAEEVTLVWAAHTPGVMEHIIPYVEEEFPHITLEFIEVHSDRDSLQEMLAAQEMPDIISTWNATQIPIFAEMELAYDMDELVEKHGFDLNRIDPAFENRMRSFAPNQELYMLPYYTDLFALYYNKDIFDMFAVDYPQDGMTWDEMLDLARELTREEGGVQYHGLNVWQPFFPGEAYEVNYVDPDTHEPIFADQHGVRQGFEMFMDLHQIPGNSSLEDWREMFLNERNLAMVALYKEVDAFVEQELETGFNWDMVSWPVFDDNPGMNPVPGGRAFGVASTSEHKDEAFQVLAYLLSDEYQTERVRLGQSTPLASDEIRQQLYADVAEVEDKNVAALYYNGYSAGPDRRSPFDNVLNEWRGELMEDLAAGGDLDEIFRKYEDMSRQYIEEHRYLFE